MKWDDVDVWFAFVAAGAGSSFGWMFAETAESSLGGIFAGWMLFSALISARFSKSV